MRLVLGKGICLILVQREAGVALSAGTSDFDRIYSETVSYRFKVFHAVPYKIKVHMESDTGDMYRSLLPRNVDEAEYQTRGDTATVCGVDMQDDVVFSGS